MKILLISSSAPFGRGESFVISEANAIGEAGWRVLLFPAVVRRGNPNRFDLHDHCELIASKNIRLQSFLLLLKYLLRQPLSIVKILWDVRSANKLNTLKNWAILPRSLWLVDYLRKSPVAHIHSHWLTTPSTMALIVSKLTGISWSVTAHRGDIVACNLLDQKFAAASFVRFISNSGVRLAKERSPQAIAQSAVIHLGVEHTTSETLASEEDRAGNDKVTILCPANLVPVKGHECLFRALSELKGFNGIEVILAGDGELKSSLKVLAGNLGIDSFVRFLGHVPHTTLLDWYRSSTIDVVVLPSRDLGGGVHEGIPVSLMEAMAHGVPVISTKTGGIPELLCDNQNQKYGYLLPPDDDEALAQALEDLISSKPCRQKFGALGRQRILSAFDREKTVAELMNLMTSECDAAV